MKKSILSLFILSMFICSSFGQKVYTFTGNGNWSDSLNWENHILPPAKLDSGSTIVINPLGNGECILNTSQYISATGHFIVNSGKSLKILDQLLVNDPSSDTLSFDEDSILSSVPRYFFTFDDLFTADSNLLAKDNPGQTGTSPYDEFLKGIYLSASNLTDIQQHIYPDEGFNKPPQTGLAYILDGQNSDSRWEERFQNQIGTDKDDKPIYCSKVSMHGLECNGFVSRVLDDAGLADAIKKLHGCKRLTTSQLSSATEINNVLKASAKFENLKYKNVGHIPIDQIRKGDIMYFLHSDGKLFHVGICARPKSDPGATYIYQSNGRPSSCEDNTPQHLNSQGISYPRGPGCLKISDFLNIATSGKLIFGNYYVLQLIHDLPSVTTTPILPSSLTPTSALSGGIINSDGGSVILTKGVCWSTSPNPTIVNTFNRSIEANELETYPSEATTLTASTFYYLRAYAINSTDTAYGDEVTFTTSPAYTYNFTSYGWYNSDIICREDGVLDPTCSDHYPLNVFLVKNNASVIGDFAFSDGTKHNISGTIDGPNLSLQSSYNYYNYWYLEPYKPTDINTSTWQFTGTSIGDNVYSGIWTEKRDDINLKGYPDKHLTFSGHFEFSFH